MRAITDFQDRIFLGDCLEGLRSLPAKCADLVLTDPPYQGHYDYGSAGGFTGEKGLTNQGAIAAFSDGYDPAVLGELVRVMKRINIYLFCSKAQIIPYLDYFVKGLGCLWEPMAWHKSNPVPAINNKFLPDTEYLLYFREPGVRLHGGASCRSTYYVTPINSRDKAEWGHPTAKPLSVLANLVEASSLPGDLVLDPFAGSGSSLAAAARLGRRFLGWELDPAYHAAASRRLEMEIDAREGALL